MERVLNQDEINKMVRAARGGRDEAAPTGPVVKPWDARQAGQIGPEQMQAISQLHESFARNLTNAVGAYLRTAFDCSLVSAEHLTFREFLQGIPENTYLASCNLAPAGAIAVIQLDLAIAFPIIEVLLGGEGQGGDPQRALTEIEEQVIENVARIVCRELQSTWHAIAIEFNFDRRHNVAQAQRLMPPEEKNLCLSFEARMSETRGSMNLAVPAVVSNALLRKISADLSYQRPQTSKEARQQLQDRLLGAIFELDLSVPNLHVRLEDLADMLPGSLLSFSHSVSAPATLAVDDVRVCSAIPVRVDSRRAARVLSLAQAPRPGGKS